jgi:hypothetical protein
MHSTSRISHAHQDYGADASNRPTKRPLLFDIVNTGTARISVSLAVLNSS